MPWVDEQMDWLNALGMDVMVLQMPGYQCNYLQPAAKWVPNSTGGGCYHPWWEEIERQGIAVGRFFVEPVVLTINYATQHLGYRNIVMTGLSGGGWTTTMAAALDPRIDLSMPVAGTTPCSFPKRSVDFEQLCNRPWNMVCDYECQYALAALEDHRYSVQLLHEFDSCCFHGHGLHGEILSYNARIRSQIDGHFETVVTVGNQHEINPRDRAVLGMMLGNFLRGQGHLESADFAAMPFNILRRWGP